MSEAGPVVACGCVNNGAALGVLKHCVARGVEHLAEKASARLGRECGERESLVRGGAGILRKDWHVLVASALGAKERVPITEDMSAGRWDVLVIGDHMAGIELGEARVDAEMIGTAEGSQACE